MKITNIVVPSAKHTRESVLVFRTYPATGELALLLMNKATHEEEATASVNVESYGAPKLPPGEVFLKGWSENEGIPEALVQAGVVELNGKIWPTGFCKAEHAKLIGRARELAQDFLGLTFPEKPVLREGHHVRLKEFEGEPEMEGIILEVQKDYPDMVIVQLFDEYVDKDAAKEIGHHAASITEAHVDQVLWSKKPAKKPTKVKPTSLNPTNEKEVHEALDNAKENGCDMSSWEIENIVNDLQEYDETSQNLPKEVVKEAVSSWLNKNQIET